MKNAKTPRPRKDKPSWQVTLFSVPFILLGVAAFIAGTYPVAQHVRSLYWEAAPGRMTGLADVAGHRHIGDQNVSRMEGGFDYVWRGQNLSSTQISFGLMRDNLDDGWREFVRETLGEPGHEITIWVNPSHPGEAVAIRDIRWIEVGLAYIAAMCFGFGGLALLWANLRGPKPQSSSASFSWPLVLTLLTSAPFWAGLAWLLWRDLHPVWAIVSGVPVLLALNGVMVGFLAYLKKRRTRALAGNDVTR